jgi:cytochrome P450
VPLPEALRAEAPYLAAAATLRATLPLRSRSVWALFPDALYRRLSPLGRGEAAATSAAHALARAALRAATPASPLGVLAASRAKELAAAAGGDAEEDSLHDAATLLFAGHDTQAATLAWCSLRLAAAPGVAARLRRHCAQAGLYSSAAGADGGACADVASSAAARVPLLEAVLRETLRLHPPAPLVVRMLEKGVECPFASAASASQPQQPQQHPPLPSGTAAAVWLYALQRDAAAWGPDADAFRPQRWLRRRRRRDAGAGTAAAASGAEDDGSGAEDDASASDDAPDGAAEPDTPCDASEAALSSRDADAVDAAAADDAFDAWRLSEGVGGGAYMPYASGPRSCVGAGVASAALRVMLARLVGGAHLAPGGDAPAAAVQLHPSVGFTVTPAAGVPLRVRLADQAGAAALLVAAART